MLPPVRGNAPDPRHRDQVDVVKAALDGRPPKQPPTGPPGGGGGPGGPSGKTPGPKRQVNWKWVRRGLGVAAVMAILLPIVTFAMAYFIVEVPKPGDIRTAQVSTILASDGSEL
ncbi:MAG: penicillin-binding protein, partial [Mycolicibacterium sp.]|nr:penicillin-binding protein [Mycolicibacterium sp.]